MHFQIVIVKGEEERNLYGSILVLVLARAHVFLLGADQRLQYTPVYNRDGLETKLQ